jgi:hypothetical protein
LNLTPAGVRDRASRYVTDDPRGSIAAMIAILAAEAEPIADRGRAAWDLRDHPKNCLVE